jgi:uncharacterized membrane protein YcaP (DUF421 family)
MLNHMFSLPLPVLEKIVRPLIVYLALVVLLRIFGKRELAQLNPFDLVVLMSLANAVQNAIIGEDNSLVGGLLGAAALLGGNYLVVRFLFRHRSLHMLLAGKSTVLIHKGRIVHRALAQEMIPLSELQILAHRQGIRDLREVEECVLDPGGVALFVRREPSTEEKRHAELMAKLDELARRLDASPQ